jgi:hypothetical protein
MSVLPSLRVALIGSLIWALAMAASAALSVWWGDWQTPASMVKVITLFAAGGLIAFVPAFVAARLVAARRRREVRIAAALIGFSGFTVGFTVLIYYLHYRGYYAQFHHPRLTITWFYHLAYTGATSLYQFAVLGMRMYLPIGLAALLVAAWWHAAR